MLHVMIDLGGSQQRLGRNAAPVQADAAEVGFLDNRGLEAELSGTNSCNIAAGARADDNDVEGSVGHFRLHLAQAIAMRRPRRFKVLKVHVEGAFANEDCRDRNICRISHCASATVHRGTHICTRPTPSRSQLMWWRPLSKRPRPRTQNGTRNRT